MIRRKHRERLRRVFGLTVAAILLNLTLPNTKVIRAQSVPSTAVDQNVSTPAPAVSTVPVPPLPTIPDKPPIVKKVMIVRASAYTSSKAETDNDPFTTASGAKVKDGIIAMNGMPFGTKVRLPEKFGNKIFVVQDRMNARWGNQRIDIWMKDRHQALQWGVRTVKMEIVK